LNGEIRKNQKGESDLKQADRLVGYNTLGFKMMMEVMKDLIVTSIRGGEQASLIILSATNLSNSRKVVVFTRIAC